MKPYYEKDGVSIFHCDFREDAMREHICEASCIVADPPYGETSLAWDKWPSGWPAYLAGRAAKNASLWCFGSARMFLHHVDEFKSWRFVQDVVWEKHNGSGFAADRFKRVHESAYQFVLEDAVWGEIYKAVPRESTKAPGQKSVRMRGPTPHTGKIGDTGYIDTGERIARSVMYAQSCHGYAVNETQKPEAIVSPLISYSCPVGGLTFSPFMGSGTDLVVARSLGMKAVGCDLREEQCEAAANRLSQGLLFAQEVA